MYFRLFFLCAVLLLTTTMAGAQEAGDENGERKRVLDNYDLSPRATQQQEKRAEKAPEARAEEPAKRKETSKKTILKTPTVAPKGEGYYSGDLAQPEAVAPPPPPPKVYSQLNASIDDSGKMILTSDTIVVKSETAPPVTLRPSETTGNKELDDLIQNAARKHQVDPRLVLEVIRQESGFRLRAVSHKGASGYMQLMPATAARFGVTRIFDPAQNIDGGTRYLRFLLDLFKGNVELALAGYNAGENAVIRNNYQIPRYRETREYVRSITARYRSKYHQVAVAKSEPIVSRPVPLTTFEAEDGRVILSNNY